MMKKKLALLVLVSLLLYSCGYKIISQQYNFNINEIKTDGDKLINFKLKNQLKIYQSSDNSEIKNLNINSKKIKNIKEKNIKNEITKYNLGIIITVEYILVQSGEKNEFTIKNEGDFEVDSKYSQTLNNEKSLLNELIDDMSDKIIENLRLELNDI